MLKVYNFIVFFFEKSRFFMIIYDILMNFVVFPQNYQFSAPKLINFIKTTKFIKYHKIIMKNRDFSKKREKMQNFAIFGKGAKIDPPGGPKIGVFRGAPRFFPLEIPTGKIGKTPKTRPPGHFCEKWGFLALFGGVPPN